jgi:flagellar biosynthesis component FlhA
MDGESTVPPAPPPTTTTTTTEEDVVVARSSTDLETIRRELRDTVETERLDKGTALKVITLFHSLETLLLHECHARDKIVLEKTASLERERLEAECDRLARRHTLDEQNLQQLAETHTRGMTRRR